MREADAESDALFERANLFPRTTGLAMTVWVSVAGRPTPHVIAGHLPPDARSNWANNCSGCRLDHPERRRRHSPHRLVPTRQA
jgi:hypothetical protein